MKFWVMTQDKSVRPRLPFYSFFDPIKPMVLPSAYTHALSTCTVWVQATYLIYYFECPNWKWI